MKKRWMISLGIFFSLIPLVSADYFGGRLGEGMSQVMGWIEEIFTPIFEALLNTDSGEFFFAKVLMLLLLFIIIFTVIKAVPRLGENRSVAFIISAVVSILSIRYIPDNDFFKGMLLPYGTLGVSLIVFLPFLIYFFFVHRSVPGNFGRRAAWAVYALVFLVLWGMREYGTDSIGAANWLYAVGIILVIVAFIFDRSIHSYFGLHELGRWEAGAHDAEVARLQSEFQQIANVDSPQAQRRRASIRVRLTRLGAELP